MTSKKITTTTTLPAVKFNPLAMVTRLEKWPRTNPPKHVYIMPWDIRRIEEGGDHKGEFTTIISRDCSTTIVGADTKVAEQIFGDWARLQGVMLAYFMTEKRRTPWMQELVEYVTQIAVAKSLEATDEQMLSRLPEAVRAPTTTFLAMLDAEDRAQRDAAMDGMKGSPEAEKVDSGL